MTDGRFRGLLLGERNGKGLEYRGIVEFGLAGKREALLSQAQRFARATSPFSERLSQRGVMWLEPQLVALVTYAEIMQERLRAPVFRGLLNQSRTFRPHDGRDRRCR